jgi:hypothetical protein
MTVRPVELTDLPTLALWCAERCVPMPMALPTRGFIGEGAYLGLEVIGDRAWLEPALTTASVPRSVRYAALADCVHAAETLCRKLGVKTIWAFTDRPTVARFAIGQGYRPAAGVLTFKELR